METELAIGEQELASLCRSGQYQKVDAALSNSQKRSSLSKTAIKLFKELSVSSANQRIAITLAVLYTCSEAELSKLRFWPGYFDESVINSSALKSVPRERLQRFAELLLDTSSMHLGAVEELIAAGLIDKPKSNGYVAGLISACSWKNKNQDGLAQTLRSRADFIGEDVWLLFTYDGTAESCLAGADKYLTNAQESWQAVLVSFSNEGLLDRNRLLDESLSALSRDFNQFRAGWFSRFHEALEPTGQERSQRLAAYLRLLNSAIPPTVSFALAMIVSIDKSSPVAFRDLANHLPGALTSKSKQTVLSALKLLQSCADREPNERKEVCMLASTALVSEQAEVQKAVIALVAKFADKEDAELKECFASYLPALSASVKSSLPAFLQSNTALATSSPPASSDAATTSLPPPSSDAALAGAARVSRPAAEVTKVSVPSSRTLTPIADLNELVLKAAFVLEHPEAFCDYELVLDGILRNSAREQRDFAVITSSLLQRARKLGAKSEDQLIGSLCSLIIVWITDELPESAGHSDVQPGAPIQIQDLRRHRMGGLMNRVRERKTEPLLSLPTDEYGWLEASELRRRLDAGSVPDDPWDKCFAILRTRGADAALMDSVMTYNAHPAAEFARLCLAAKESIDEKPLEWAISARTSHGHMFTTISVHTEPGTMLSSGGNATEQEKSFWGYYVPGSQVLFEGGLMTNLRQLYFAAGAKWLGACLQYTDVPAKAARFYLHFLQDPATNAGAQGSLLLVLAVSTGDQDITVAGIDGFIMLIAQERLDFESTADAMFRLFHHGDCIKANRWAKNFAEIRKASPEHSRVVYALLQHVLSAPLATSPKDLHHILELLVELQAENGGKLNADTVKCLTSLKVSGKTRKLADQLVAAI